MKIMAKTIIMLSVLLGAVTSFAQSFESYIPADCDMYIAVDGAAALKNPALKPLMDQLLELSQSDSDIKVILKPEAFNAKLAMGIKFMKDDRITGYAAIELGSAQITEKMWSDIIKSAKEETAGEKDFKLTETLVNGKKACTMTDSEASALMVRISPTLIQAVISSVPDAKLEVPAPGKNTVALPKDGIFALKLNSINPESDGKMFKSLSCLVTEAGDEVKIAINAVAADARTFKDISEQINAALAAYRENPETAKLAKKTVFTAKDGTLSISCTMNAAELTESGKMAGAMLLPILLGTEEEIEFEPDEVMETED